MKKEKSSVRHIILTVVGTILCIILIPILVINCLLIVKSYTDKDTVPNISGVFPIIVLTNSMYPEIESGDLILCRQIDAEAVQVGDVICFFDPAGKGTATVTHRVTEITTDEDGGLAWVTKGDANNTEDSAVVPAEKLVGIYYSRIAGAGNIAMFMQSTQGLIICVFLPMAALVAYDIIRRRIYEKNNRKDTNALREELEALRAEKEKNSKSEAEALRAELEALRAEKEKNSQQ